jgi:hypothetical protein
MLTSTVQLDILAHPLQSKGQPHLFSELFRNESLSPDYVPPHDFFGSVGHAADSLDRVRRPKFSSKSECRKSANAVFAFIPAVGGLRISRCAHNSFPCEFDDGCYGSCHQLSPKPMSTSGHRRFNFSCAALIGEVIRGKRSMEWGKHQVTQRQKEVANAA